MKRNFWGFYSNQKYQVGLSGTVWVYDMADNLIGRFRETPNTYRGAFMPGTDIFVTHTNECHLVVYDLANMKLVKKIKTSNCKASEDTGLAFTNDGKFMYCVQAGWNDWLSRRIVVYDTSDFSVVDEYYSDQSIIKPHVVEFDEDGICYVLCSVQYDEKHSNSLEVGMLQNGIITDRRHISDNWLTVRQYFSYKSSGDTLKAYDMLYRLTPYMPDDYQEPITLKRMHETGHM